MRKMIPAGAAAAVAATLAIAVGATASPSPRTEHFSLMNISNNPRSNVYSAIATGEFTAGGTITLGSHGHPGTLRFPNGTIKVIAKLRPFKTQGNIKTCLVRTVGSGTYTLVSGTRAYNGITGSGKLRLVFRAVGPIVNGKCSIPTPTTTTVADQNIITLSGPVSLP
jgi:hypothetical protein